jgi:hypothetical protein
MCTKPCKFCASTKKGHAAFTCGSNPRRAGKEESSPSEKTGNVKARKSGDNTHAAVDVKQTPKKVQKLAVTEVEEISEDQQ